MSKHPIVITENIRLPLDIVTQSIAILAKRRAGKSYLARRFTEQLLAAGQQIVIVDPKGDAWGIRSSADGKRPGFPIIVLGGEHGDLPLEATAGELIAKLVVEERVSILLDLSRFRKYEVAEFMGGQLRGRGRGNEGFLEALYRLKAQERFRDAMMLIVDEADAIAPQRPQQGEERMLGAIEDIIRRGGQRGIGSLLISQRSAVIHKDVLTQTQIMVAMRMIAPQDLAAIRPWFEVHGLREQLNILMDSLPSLPVGDAWVSSPGWPDDRGIFTRGHILPIETFDSGATPKPGEKRIEPKTAADIDLPALERQMAETIERVKADDPKELRRRIAELENQVNNPAAAQPSVAASPDPDRIVAAREKGAKAERRRIKAAVHKALTKFSEMVRESYPLKITVSKGQQELVLDSTLGNDLVDQLDKAMLLLDKTAPVEKEEELPPARDVLTEHRRRRPSELESIVPTDEVHHHDGNPLNNGSIPKAQQKILAALAEHHSTGCSRPQLTLLTGYARSTRDRQIQYLQAAQMVEVRGDRVFASAKGLDMVGGARKMPAGKDLQKFWLDRLPEAQRAILAVLFDARGDYVSTDKIDAATGYARSTRDRQIQYLKARELVEGERGQLRAMKQFFD